LTTTGPPARRPGIVNTVPPSPATPCRGGASSSPEDSARKPSATASMSAAFEISPSF
jgi:hypothetical protein